LSRPPSTTKKEETGVEKSGFKARYKPNPNTVRVEEQLSCIFGIQEAVHEAFEKQLHKVEDPCGRSKD
jgi:hypothetical protein